MSDFLAPLSATSHNPTRSQQKGLYARVLLKAARTATTATCNRRKNHDEDFESRQSYRGSRNHTRTRAQTSRPETRLVLLLSRRCRQCHQSRRRYIRENPNGTSYVFRENCKTSCLPPLFTRSAVHVIARNAVTKQSLHELKRLSSYRDCFASLAMTRCTLHAEQHHRCTLLIVFRGTR